MSSTDGVSSVAQGAAEIKKETGELLQGFDKSHSEMSSQLKSELAKMKLELARMHLELANEGKARRQASQAQAKQRTGEVSTLRSDTREMVKGFRKELVQTAAAWRSLIATMQPRERKAIAASPAKATLENRILDLIREHPQGIKLTAIAQELGEARIKLGNITRMMIDEGKLRKEGSLYFMV